LLLFLVGEMEAKFHVQLNSTSEVGQRYILALFPKEKYVDLIKGKFAPVLN
jgi:hypothetical protein